MTSAPSIVIAPSLGRRSLSAEARELWQFRALIPVLVRRELRVRYRNSALGIGWSLVNPLVQVFVLTLFVGYILSAGPSNLSAYILCAYLPWTFFQTGVLDASVSVAAQANLLKKVYFPREIFVIAAVCANFIHFLMALCVFVVYRWGFLTLTVGWPGAPPLAIFWLPAVVAVEFLLILGVSFFSCAWRVFYEDVQFVITMLMNVLFYLTPVAYFAENVFYSPRLHEHLGQKGVWWLYHLYLANPLAWIVTAFKQMFFPPQIISNRAVVPVVQSAAFDPRYFLIALAMSLAFCLLGYQYFNARKWKFAERP
ncbi:MAG: ABC transporter permease [Armatimonadota bacterium]|nr:ABC transporter permease [Armatimonadota bacterium]